MDAVLQELKHIIAGQKNADRSDRHFLFWRVRLRIAGTTDD